MVTLNQARFTIDGSPSQDPVTGNRGHIAALGATLDVTLEVNPSPVLSVLYEVYDPTDGASPMASKDAPLLTWVASSTSKQSFSSPNSTAQITVPASGVQSYVIRCTAALAAGGSDVFERMIVNEVTSTTPNLRKTVPAESAEYRERSWSDDLNDLLQIISGIVVGTGNLDISYNAFGANPAIVTIDGSEGQGDLRLNPTGAYSLDIDISGNTGAVDGLLVSNGADYFNFIRKATDTLDIETQVQNIDLNVSNAFTMDAVAASNVTVSGASADLTLGARGSTITLNQSGNTALDASYGAAGATSIIGALNVLVTGPGILTDMNEAYDNFGSNPANVVINDAEGQGDLVFKPTGAFSHQIDLSGNTGTADGFLIDNGADYLHFLYNAANQINIDSNLNDISINASSDIEIDAGASSDLTFGARGDGTTLNESGQEGLTGFTSASSIIGGLNECRALTEDDIYNNTSGTHTVTVDDGKYSYELDGTNNFDIYIENNSDTYGFQVYDDTDYFRLYKTSGSSINLTAELVNITMNASVRADIQSNSAMYLQKHGGSGVYFFNDSSDGETSDVRIYGYASGASLRYLGISCGSVADDTASFTNLSNYDFAGNVSLDDDFTLTGGGLVTSTSNGNITITPHGTGDLILTTPTIADLTNATHDHADASGGGLIPPANIIFDKISTPTYDDLKDWFNTTQSAGVVSGGSITDGGSGTVDVSTVYGVVKTTDSTIGTNNWFQLAGLTSQALTDNVTNYIAVDYNSGTPQWVVSTSNTANGHTIFNVGKVFREGTGVDIVDSGLNIYDFTKRVQQHHSEEESLHFVSGAIVGETGTLNISITAGVMYAGINRIETDAIDTSVADDFEYYYNDGAWQETDETDIDNLQYNDFGTGLATLDNNRYGVHWVYKGTGTSTYVVYGQDSYTLVEAQSAQPPSSLPEHVDGFGVLRAKIIIAKSASVFTEIESVTDTQFQASTPSNHNELANIQGGAADDYYHLTGTNAGYINQDVQTTSSPTFVNATFSGKTAGSVLFAGASGVLTEDNSNLFWDNSSNEFGVGTNSPSYRLSIGSADASDQIGIYHNNTDAYFKWTDGELNLQTDEGTNTDTVIVLSGKGTGFSEIVSDGYRLEIPTSADGYSGMVDYITVDTNPGVGGLVYKKSNGNYASADADAETTMLATHLILETGTGAGIKALRYGYFNDDASASLGGGIADTLFVSTTAGSYVVEASKPSGTGDIVQTIGARETADVIFFNPSRDWVKIS